MWMGVSIALSLLLSFFLPFYIALPLLIGIFIGINYYLRRRMMKRVGAYFPSLDLNPVKYYCMVCGTKHREVACPNCGSKMKRVG